MLKIFKWDLLPEIKYSSILIKFDDDVEEFFKVNNDLINVKERARAARMFFVGQCASGEAWRLSAHLRAGLSEYVSMSEALNVDCRKLGLGKPPKLLIGSANPIVFAMYLIRNINVHASCTSSDFRKSSIIWNDPQNPKEIDIDIGILNDDFESQLLNYKDARKLCSEEDILRICDWIKTKQLEFGVGHLLNKGLSCYFREIIEWYNKSVHLTPKALG